MTTIQPSHLAAVTGGFVHFTLTPLAGTTARGKALLAAGSVVARLIGGTVTGGVIAVGAHVLDSGFHTHPSTEQR